MNTKLDPQSQAFSTAASASLDDVTLLVGEQALLAACDASELIEDCGFQLVNMQAFSIETYAHALVLQLARMCIHLPHERERLRALTALLVTNISVNET